MTVTDTWALYTQRGPVLRLDNGRGALCPACQEPVLGGLIADAVLGSSEPALEWVCEGDPRTSEPYFYTATHTTYHASHAKQVLLSRGSTRRPQLQCTASVTSTGPESSVSAWDMVPPIASATFWA